ncbi:MAG: restriction endonuclease [Gammaproteobacteria bacterium]|nr:restriction endonuclease [Gammaproteobacteria bacterium]MCY4165887.1 restriction endonuclease [Gammaproteobacteria bacterium]MCY4339994.1 restriction endonuclease [Gammaproteobacteria bacterium]
MNENALTERLRDIRQHYLDEMRAMWCITEGGALRSRKGKLVENMAKKLVRAAWENLGRPNRELEFRKGKHDIPLNKEYLDRISPADLLNSIREDRAQYVYKLGCDVQCYLRGTFALAVECKAYAEVAMLKRVLIDATLLSKKYPGIECVLLQLESQLGGDYKDAKYPPKGSPSAHTVMSHFAVDLTILTLLRGERRVKKPIHREKYFKDLTLDSLRSAVNELEKVLKRCESRMAK